MQHRRKRGRWSVVSCKPLTAPQGQAYGAGDEAGYTRGAGMSRLKVAAAVTVLLLSAVGCGHMEDPGAAAKASPSPSGPVWEAYQAGRSFGREHKDTARIPDSVARTSDPQGSVQDAVEADSENARWWCQRNLPAELESEHEDHGDALTAGCVGGVLPLMDTPELWAR